MRQVHLFTVRFADVHQALLDRRQHSQPQQIHLDDAHVGAVFFVPLHHHAAGHSGRFQRHHRIQLTLADHHAAGMLPQVPRQILHGLVQLQKFAYARILQVQVGVAEMPFGRIAGVLPFPRPHQARQAIQRHHLKSQRFAHLARRRLPAIGNHIGRHGRAQLAVALVDILNGALPLLAAGQVQVDIRPLAALLRQKALEQQIHPHRVHRRDPQRITHRAVGRRAAPLRQNATVPAEIHDVPNDQEIAVQRQLFDQRQFALDLPPRFVVIRMVAPPRAFIRPFTEKRSHALAFRHRIARKFVAQIRQREFQARRNLTGVRDGFRQIGEQPRHLRAGLDIALRIGREQPSGGFERHLFAHAGEHIQHFPLPRSGVANAIGGHQRNAQPPRLFDDGLVAGFLVAVHVPLQFGIEMPLAENARQRFIDIRRNANQPVRKLSDLFQSGGACAFFGAQFHACNQAAQVPIALAVFAQQRIALAVRARDFGADVRAHPRNFRRHMKTRRPIDAIPVEQRHGRNAQIGASGNQILGHRRPLQKTKSRSRM